MAAIVSAAALSGGALATQPVAITNAGFELPVLTNGSISSGAIPGWSAFNSGVIAVLNPTVSDLSGEAPEGENVGLVTSGTTEDGFTQTLAATFQAGADYLLTAKVANTKFSLGFPGYRIQLLAGATVLAEDNNSQAIAEDGVITATANYTYNPANAGLAGQPLEIRLLSKGLAGSQEVAFDDVRLTATLADPAANAGGPYEVAIPDGTLSLNGSNSLPANGQSIVSWEWDLTNDGNFNNASGATPAAIPYATLIAAPPTGFGMVEGANIIRLRITDDSSPAKSSIAETTVTLAELGTTMTANGNWNGGAWDNGQPTIGLDATIAAGVTATATNSVTPWSGKLTLEPGSTLIINATVNPNPANMVFDGATAFILKDGSKINDHFKTATFAQNFVITGTAGMDCNNNNGNNHNRTFTGTISGGTFFVDGRNHVGYTFNSPNTFANFEARASESQRYGVAFNAPGAAGLGNVTVTSGGGTQSGVIILGANNVFSETCVLTLNGRGWGNSTGGFGPYAAGAWVGNSMRIFMNTFNATVSELWIDGIQRPAGTYTGTSGDWIGGTGTLTVLNSPDDSDPPTLLPSDIVDNVSGGPIFETETVTYKLTFNEPLDPATVSIDAFENGGSAPATIQSAIVNDAVVTVVVTLNGPGSLVLQLKAGATISDYMGNAMNNTAAIADDTTITVNPEIPPTVVSIESSVAGAAVFQNQAFTYFVTFDKALNPATVDPSDFENGTGPAITVTKVTAYNNPTVYAVDVVPSGPGTITLQIKEGANLTSAYGTPINTTAAIPDDTAITVNAGSAPPRATITVDKAISWSAAAATLTGTLDASGSDKLVVIVTGEHGNPGDHSGNSSAVTYDGVPLTKILNRKPIAGTPQDQTFNDIWYLDLDGVTTVNGTIVANVTSRGNVSAFALSGTAPGVGQTAISPQASKSVVLSTGFANSIVIASHGMGGDGNTANVTAVSVVAPLEGRRATAQTSGSPAPWDGHVTAYALLPAAGTDTYSFSGGNVVGSHTIAAEFVAAEATGTSAYGLWAGGFTGLTDAAPSLDFDGGGLATGLEWVLGGDPTNPADDTTITPTFDATGDPEFVVFTHRRAQAAHADSANTSIIVEYGSDLGSDPSSWTVAEAGPNVLISVNSGGAGPGIDLVEVKIRRTEAIDGRLFARLRVLMSQP